jgi:hypothetical protein
MRLLRTRNPCNRLRRSINNNISPQNSNINTLTINTPHTAAVSPFSPSHPISVVVLPNPTVTPRSRRQYKCYQAASDAGFGWDEQDG